MEIYREVAREGSWFLGMKRKPSLNTRKTFYPKSSYEKLLSVCTILSTKPSTHVSWGDSVFCIMKSLAVNIIQLTDSKSKTLPVNALPQRKRMSIYRATLQMPFPHPVFTCLNWHVTSTRARTTQTQTCLLYTSRCV